MTSTNELVFWSGAGAYTLAMLLFQAASTYLWTLRRHANPGHLMTAACATQAVLYWSMLVDWNVVLRSDGVEAIWLRPVADVVVYLCYSWALVTALWMDVTDAWIVMGLSTLGGVFLIGGDVVSVPIGWWWWSFGVGAQLLALAFVVRRMRRPGAVAYALWVGWMVFALGVPVVQALSWTMGGVISVSPRRSPSEIAYVVVSGAGTILYGVALLLLWSKAPLRFGAPDKALHCSPMAPDRATHLERVQAQSVFIPPQLRHRSTAR
jgi:hypothetical protein